jgi:hypothetical protein
MKQFLKSIGLYGLISFLFFNGIAFLCLFILGKSNFYKPCFVKNRKNSNSFDYVVLGSSTGLTTLDTKLIDSLSGKKGLNISMDDSSLNTQYLMLQHFLNSEKKTKCLVLAVTPWDLENNSPKLNNNDYRFLPFINEDYVYEYYLSMESDLFKPLAYSKYIPLIGMSYYNTELFYPSILAAVNSKKRNRFDDLGNYSYPSYGSPNKINNEVINLELNNPYFSKISKLCEFHNIRLVSYISPIYKTKVNVDGIMIELVNHSSFITDKKMFYDNIHVNKIGRRVCSKEFAKYIN